MKALIILIEDTGDREAMMKAFADILDHHALHPDLGCLSTDTGEPVSWEVMPVTVPNIYLSEAIMTFIQNGLIDSRPEK